MLAELTASDSFLDMGPTPLQAEISTVRRGLDPWHTNCSSVIAHCRVVSVVTTSNDVLVLASTSNGDASFTSNNLPISCRLPSIANLNIGAVSGQSREAQHLTSISDRLMVIVAEHHAINNQSGNVYSKCIVGELRFLHERSLQEPRIDAG